MTRPTELVILLLLAIVLGMLLGVPIGSVHKTRAYDKEISKCEVRAYDLQTLLNDCQSDCQNGIHKKLEK